MKIKIEGKVSNISLDNKGRVTAGIIIQDYRYTIGQTDEIHIDGTDLELGQKVTVVITDDLDDSSEE